MKALSFIIVLVVSSPLWAQVHVPPSGNNQKSSITQCMGLVCVTVDYNSPDVTDKYGNSRDGEIWGDIVPYGLANLGFGESSDENPSPWRAGANENTVFTTTHDILVQGKMLPAGSYGFFIIPEEDSIWTVIFSKENSAWGSYFYQPEDEVLRVESRIESSEMTEWLQYNFGNRQLNTCNLHLDWERVSLTLRLEVPDIVSVYLDQIRQDLKGEAGFSHLNYVKASQFCLTNQTNLDEALEWADIAIEDKWVGVEIYTTLMNKSAVLEAMDRKDESLVYLWKAVKHPTASSYKIHSLGRRLIAMGYQELALEVFEYNYERFEGAWPTNVGMARGLSANQMYDEAIPYAERALELAPDDLNRKNLENALILLIDKKDIN